ncbi:hypothetical protein [Burkholderia ubonensis]|uniref:hypothetical protein n=1 Tax=Burkholderia ubonensis TaxID=101571 RepID=UPI0008FE6AFA|nr:hypothetical protein [Burkholderia ubonensis]
MAFLQYGNTIRLINNYGGWDRGGALGIVPGNGGADTVGTYLNFPENDQNTQWTVEKLATTGNGTYIYSGDQIRLKNVADGNYLTLYSVGRSDLTGYTVKSAPPSRTDPTLIVGWTVAIYHKQGGNDPRLDSNDAIYLVSTFGASLGGSLAAVLDTNGVGTSGLTFGVTGSRLVNRDGGSGQWQVKNLSNFD